MPKGLIVTFSVIVIGAGPGGLCLAHGLRRHGIRVDVYERDSSSAHRTQGFRVRVNGNAVHALQSCLPASLFRLFLATCGKPERRVTTRSHKLIEITSAEFPRVEPEPLDAPRTVNRLTLREILLTDLADELHFNADFTGYRQRCDGTVEAYFADGRTAHADLLVGADGAGSRVRGQLIPSARITESGRVSIYGFAALVDDTRHRLPQWILDGYTSASCPRGDRLGFGVMEFRQRPADAASQLHPAARLTELDDYLTCVYSAPRGRLGVDNGTLRQLTADELNSLVRTQLADWHPELRALLPGYFAGRTFFWLHRASMPVEPWPTTSVTLLGDAIHLMPPTGGLGMSTALRDAQALAWHLARADQHSLRDAVHAYETDLLDYGFAAVRSALRISRGTNG